MRTKYILHIDGTDYELRDDDLENWEQIKCSRSEERRVGKECRL